MGSSEVPEIPFEIERGSMQLPLGRPEKYAELIGFRLGQGVNRGSLGKVGLYQSDVHLASLDDAILLYFVHE